MLSWLYPYGVACRGNIFQQFDVLPPICWCPPPLLSAFQNDFRPIHFQIPFSIIYRLLLPLWSNISYFHVLFTITSALFNYENDKFVHIIKAKGQMMESLLWICTLWSPIILVLSTPRIRYPLLKNHLLIGLTSYYLANFSFHWTHAYPTSKFYFNLSILPSGFYISNSSSSSFCFFILSSALYIHKPISNLFLEQVGSSGEWQLMLHT